MRIKVKIFQTKKLFARLIFAARTFIRERWSRKQSTVKLQFVISNVRRICFRATKRIFYITWENISGIRMAVSIKCGVFIPEYVKHEWFFLLHSTRNIKLIQRLLQSFQYFALYFLFYFTNKRSLLYCKYCLKF